MAARRRQAPTQPNVVILAGPNGAGKSTAAPRLLRDTLAVSDFVNADVIARGLSEFAPERMALAAGRIMLERLHELAAQRASFAFETTLASRSFAPWVRDLCAGGYQFRLVYLWVPNPEFSIARVEQRVALGGHFVPDEVIRRRYEGGLRNFFELYQPLAHEWRFYDNTLRGRPRLVACGSRRRTRQVADRRLWDEVRRTYA